MQVVSEQELFTLYPLRLEADLFPLLMEAKPCVLLLPLTHSSQSEIYQLLKEFKDYRLAQGGQARDPALRIVVLSERDVPRGNWTQLGTYELMTGPVLPNVFSFKLSRHYNKALSVSDFVDELPLLAEAILIEDPPPGPEPTEWRTFSVRDKVAEPKTTHLFTLALHLPELKPEKGSWIQQETDDPFEEHWEWEPHPHSHSHLQTKGVPDPNPYSWQFSGEKPVYIPARKTWEFKSDSPQLYKTRKSGLEEGRAIPLIEHCEDALGGEKLKAKAELRVESIEKKTFGLRLNQTLKKPSELPELRRSMENTPAQKAPLVPKPTLEDAIRKRSENLAELKQSAHDETDSLIGMKETEAPNKSNSSSAQATATQKGIRAPLFQASAKETKSTVHTVPLQNHPKVFKEAEYSEQTQVAALIGEDSTGEPTKVKKSSKLAAAKHPQSQILSEANDAFSPAIPADPERVHETVRSPRSEKQATENETTNEEEAGRNRTDQVSSLEDKTGNFHSLQEKESPGAPTLSTAPAFSKPGVSPSKMQNIELSEDPQVKNASVSAGLNTGDDQAGFMEPATDQKRGKTVISADLETSAWSALFDDNEKGSISKKRSKKSSSAINRKGWSLTYIKKSKKDKLSIAPNPLTPIERLRGESQESFVARILAFIRDRLGLGSD